MPDSPGQPRMAPGLLSWSSFLFFQDPDGNGWAVQEAPAPLAQR
ncbi:hypothetical protein [Streptomyces sp. NPDC050416]